MATPRFPIDFEAQCTHIKQEKRHVIALLAVRSRNLGRALDHSDDADRLTRLDALLNALDSEVEMSPDLKRQTQIDEGLKLMLHGPGHFSGEHKEKAQKLLDKWESQNWGGPPPGQTPTPPESASGEASRSPVLSPTRSRPESSSSEGYVRPPPDHPIWGQSGIMHGIVLKKNSKRRVYLPNPEYRKRESRVHGHNGIRVGQWYALQVCAWFHGAHGSKDAGIAGDPVNGAYSVVIAGRYDDLDTDLGYTVYYSGSGSHENEDSNRVARSSHGTKALQRSLATGRPVRLLRAASGKSSWAPTEGLRYDGLYRVVRSRTPRNSKGGLYEQFELKRLEDGQPSLESYKNTRPTRQERSDFDMIKLGYRGVPRVFAAEDEEDISD